MPPATAIHTELRPETREFYRQAITILNRAEVPFLVGGAYALERFTGIARHTRDIDIFLRPCDCHRAIQAFRAAGYRAELTFPHWLAKVFHNGDFIDLIFSSGNGLANVDDSWFVYSVADEVVGEPVRLCPVEETVWSKAFVAERERYDGADVAHLLRARMESLDWPRLLWLFGSHWRLLYAHLVLFGYIYPAERERVPAAVLEVLMARLREEQEVAGAPEPVCQGTMLSREQYLTDILEWGYKDGRLPPGGRMSAEAIEHWTRSIGENNPAPIWEGR
jgi:hypothetical protein